MLFYVQFLRGDAMLKIGRPSKPEDMLLDCRLYAPNAFPLYLVSMGCRRCGKGFYTERSGRDDYQLLHTTVGLGRLKTKDMQVDLYPGSYVLIDCSEYHYYGCVDDKWTYTYIHFKCNGGQAYMDLLGSLPYVASAGRSDMLDVYMNELLAHRTEDTDIDNAARCALTAMLLSLLAEDRKRCGDAPVGTVSQALQFIQMNYMYPLDINSLLAKTHMSRYHFCHKFKAEVGVSPYRYITDFRLKKAAELMKNRELTVLDIARLCGFASATAFIRSYRQNTGHTPGKARRNGS